jgi:hypothetical protein
MPGNLIKIEQQRRGGGRRGHVKGILGVTE